MTPGSPSSKTRKKVLIFIVAYYAESTIEQVISQIPIELKELCDVQILVIDDASKDRTFPISLKILQGKLSFPLEVLCNPVNQGYGGNQKLGYQYALKHDFDIVALVHGDGQYAPEMLPQLVQPLLKEEAEAVFGSRMSQGWNAIKGGMPLYKFVGNRILTTIQNWLLGSQLSEFHSGYRLYSVAALKKIPFELNSNVFHFDTEIIIQFLLAGFRIKEIPIPTHYGNEVCRVNGVKYAEDVLRASIAARLQRYHLVYRRNFDIARHDVQNVIYEPKMDYDSSHTLALAEIENGNVVLDIGCGPGHMAKELKKRNCTVIGMDRCPPQYPEYFDNFYVKDLDIDALPPSLEKQDVVLMLDIIEHLRSPEKFLQNLRLALDKNISTKIVFTTPNIGFFIVRFMLLFGEFNYGKRGILDMTHTRLLTFRSLQRLLEENGFKVEKLKGIPPPFGMVMKNKTLSGWILWINQFLLKISPGLFSYQIMAIARPYPTLNTLYLATLDYSAKQKEKLARNQ